ncbi:MAG: class I SAM-dependent methyltransferase [Flavobacteriales bacterium]|nr:class I SAM-dependent methyltransferase [Flavobacteriales bacterium]MBP7407606.1 class I SAM-dependent methyltransferase [Flavobacteriales bacterium]
MDHRDAVNMLRNAPLAIGAQRWADLGCGTGTFTRALADLLPPGSSIAAMDRDASALEQVPEMHGTTRSTKHTGDFATGPLPETELDGILLANALHFVHDQAEFIRRATTYLKPTGAFLLVEYDTDSPNPWVPHPLSFATLERLFTACGFASVTRLAERPSAFGRARLYSVWAERGGAA